MSASQNVAPPADAPVSVKLARPDAFASDIENWRLQLTSAGVVCRDVAYASADGQSDRLFADPAPELAQAWQQLCGRVVAEKTLALGRWQQDMLMAVPMPLPQHGVVILGLLISPPFNEKTVQLVQLSLGWLQLAISSKKMSQAARSARILELLGHILSQDSARGAAQDWINRVASWARAEMGEESGLALTLFSVENSTPNWWVSSDTAWVEKGASALQDLTELATCAAVEMREQIREGRVAIPVLDAGEPTAVLLATSDRPLDASALALLHACAGLAEPLLRRWRFAERPLLTHGVDSTKALWRKLTGPGHLTWKVGGAALVLALAVLTLWPVQERVTANLVVEGRVRQMVTAPFDGFVLQAAVRPGDHVGKGQLLAALDDRELKLEHGKNLGERDQAEGKLRQAMTERDAAAIQLASADLKQIEARLALVDAKLARAQLCSPLSGIVVSGDWTQQIGTPVETGKEMFEVATTDAYRVVLHVADSDMAQVKVGQGGVLRLASLPQHTYDFKVATITATASVQDGKNGFRVEAQWTGTPPPLSPGMQGVGKVAIGEANLVSIWTRPLVNWLHLKIWSWLW
ncbi:MAG: HlyD family efflux transporter periplasmic adaptor subunit [Rubrivivax sp.]|nr:MAG: HlyD family efflux transporter periplasmic adaptor subunit [Rubrivivax sp.]